MPALFSRAPKDDEGYEKREILLLANDLKEAKAQQQQLQRQGFKLLRRTRLKAMDLFLSVFRTPAGVDAGQARRQLGAYGEQIALNHHYQPQQAEAVFSPSQKPSWAHFSCPLHIPLGLLDGAVDTQHPALHSRQIRVINLLHAGETPGGAGHATAIASLIFGDREKGGLPLLPEAELINVAIYRQRGERIEATTEKIMIGLDRLAQAEIPIILLSLGGPANELLHLAITRLSERGVLMVAAAGNGGGNGSPFYPAAWPEVIAVTAVDRLGHAFEGATHGHYIDVAAPGIQLKVAWPPATTRRVSGTSYAVPFAAAALGVLLAEGLSPDQARHRLQQLTIDLGAPGHDPVFGHGMLAPPKCESAIISMNLSSPDYDLKDEQITGSANIPPHKPERGKAP